MRSLGFVSAKRWSFGCNECQKNGYSDLLEYPFCDWIDKHSSQKFKQLMQMLFNYDDGFFIFADHFDRNFIYY